MEYLTEMQKIVDNFFSSSKVLSYYSKPRLRLAERKLFKIYLKKKGKVLDLGCGAGRVAIPLAKMGFEVIGVDNNPKMIDAANALKRKYNVKNVKFIRIDASRMKFKKESFDYVLMMENSLEHIPGRRKREKILRKVNKPLHSDGLLILSFHSYFYPLKRFLKIQMSNISNLIKKNFELNDCILNTKKGKIYFHCFTPFEIENLLRRTGFKISAVISLNQLDKTKNRLKSNKVYSLITPLLYTFWVAKKDVKRAVGNYGELILQNSGASNMAVTSGLFKSNYIKKIWSVVRRCVKIFNFYMEDSISNNCFNWIFSAYKP
jgi:2-polyprenyl-3-methyl-5-hydroxy-6-metoxy-1,4-benzoquinol methylase